MYHNLLQWTLNTRVMLAEKRSMNVTDALGCDYPQLKPTKLNAHYPCIYWRNYSFSLTSLGSVQVILFWVCLPCEIAGTWDDTCLSCFSSGSQDVLSFGGLSNLLSKRKSSLCCLCPVPTYVLKTRLLKLVKFSRLCFPVSPSSFWVPLKYSMT